MKECWINVYEFNKLGWTYQSKNSAILGGIDSKVLYRLHVRLK